MSRVLDWLKTQEYSDIDELGNITDLGKFEAEPLYTAFYHDCCMDGGGDETLYEVDTPIEIFFFDAEEWKMFNFDADIHCIVYSEDGNGFAHAEQLTKAEYDQLLIDLDSEYTESEFDEQPDATFCEYCGLTSCKCHLK